jgi:hypothetical protein
MQINRRRMLGVPPFGNTFKVQSVHWYTLKDGLVIKHHTSRGDIGIMRQLGLLPGNEGYDLLQK